MPCLALILISHLQSPNSHSSVPIPLTNTSKPPNMFSDIFLQHRTTGFNLDRSMTTRSQGTQTQIGQLIRMIDGQQLGIAFSMLEEIFHGLRGNRQPSHFPLQKQNTWPSLMHQGMRFGFALSSSNLVSSNPHPFH